MKVANWNHRKLVWLATSFAIGILSWMFIRVLLQGDTSRSGQGVAANEKDIEKDVDENIPQPDLSPADVVRLQVNSIRDGLKDTAKLKTCYSLASPGNRTVTGPFPRFAELFLLPPYDRLATCVDWQVGSTFVDKDFAAVFVSTISKQGEVSGFRFVLHRQDFPRAGCWLTEGVQSISSESIGTTTSSTSSDQNITPDKNTIPVQNMTPELESDRQIE